MKEEILELFCGYPVDCESSTLVKFDDIIKNKIDELENLFKNNSDYNKGVQDCINLIKK